jgi:Cof subfamily protein (haloacid dehalogenase superfamily)
MFRSVRPYLEQAGLDEPVVCYQGAAVVEPRSGRFLVHEPIPLDVAREAVELLVELGHPPNCYVGDELFVAEHTAYSRAYADFQRLPVTEVGDLLAWLDRPPTKLVAVGEPAELPAVRTHLAGRLEGRVFLTTSLPYLLELGHPGVSKGSGLAHVAALLGIEPERTVAFGDGENDLDLLAWAGFGVAVERAHPELLAAADWLCPGPEEDGVARVIERHLDLHSAG